MAECRPRAEGEGEMSTKKLGPKSGRLRNKLDDEIANRIREYRLARGMTQQDLGNELGVTFQQIQKYERGMNRVTAGRLYDIARALGVPIAQMFDGKRR